VDYGVYGVPETFFIDREGRVRFKQVGAVTDAIMAQYIETLLGEPA
jgi:cytochrome c biogenesis protein CcmG/thiol:disulfide interchange protein DsbE